jgi:ADP-heptose:LPS heptosyltransferase
MIARDQDSIDWSSVKRVLVIRLRSIGDTVLATPSLVALKRFLPDAEIDILLEDWVAPLIDGHDAVHRVIAVGSQRGGRLLAAREIRRQRYDVVFNLHGGTTAGFFTRASGAHHRVGYRDYQYNFLYNHRLSSANEYWGQEFTHSAEQQLALLGFVGVPVDDRPKTSLTVTKQASTSISEKLAHSAQRDPQSAFALFHPAAAFATKQWAVDNFARTAEFLAGKGIGIVAVAAKNESAILEDLRASSGVPIVTFDDLSLPEINALASKARLFVGNDSGIAHIAAAVGIPTVVVFGSSNRNHWRPWTDAPNEIVFEEFACQPCPGYVCAEFGEPRCILSVEAESVFSAIDRVLVVENVIE